MIIHKECNIFDGGAQGIIHQANCQNTMRSGIAKEIRSRYPEAYEADCKTIAGYYKKLGTFSSVKTNDGKFVIYNCYSQFNYGREKRQTNYEAMYTGLVSIEQNARELGLTTLSLPYNMGCGLAGGSWRIVSAIIEEVFDDNDIDLFICKFNP